MLIYIVLYFVVGLAFSIMFCRFINSGNVTDEMGFAEFLMITCIWSVVLLCTIGAMIHSIPEFLAKTNLGKKFEEKVLGVKR